ncbi:heliorhodopsin HeR [Patescibacteria group bacterium]|nr:heliorhodopsin HeR [Patescibacteria group bacterium]
MSEQTKRYPKLRRWNLVMALLHAVQGAVVLYLSTDFKLPVTAGYLDFNVAAQKLEPASHTLFDIPLAYLVVTFFFICSLAHLIIATVWRRGYERDISKGLNRARWFEYSLSASTMMVAIAMLVGIYEITQLAMIFGLTAVMNLMGLVMEIHNQTTEKTKWVSYIIGVLAGAIPWLVIAVYFWTASAYGTGDIPTFVYWIYVSIFIFFNCFAINMILQYKKIGRWREYSYGEWIYIVLSLVAKSALAWQVFTGTLRP